jgi:hypothetical protein
MLLLTDGSVIVQGLCSNLWYRLTPDASGSYANGTWNQIASMSSSYQPLYYASAVLPDGRVIVEGGEYNTGCSTEVWLANGAIYDPVANTWHSVSPPSGWTSIGDAPSAVLANGTFMLGQIAGIHSALLNAKTLKWTPTGAGKADSFSEEGLSLLGNGDVLTVDTENGSHAERYSPSTGTWSSAGSTPSRLSSGDEIGPQVLMPSGDVVAFGTSGANAFYKPNTPSGSNPWSAAPSFPVLGGQQFSAADAPAVVLPDGDVLIASDPYNSSTGWQMPTHFFDLHGSTISQVTDSPNAPNDYSYFLRMLVLPTGQVLVNDAGTLEIYTDGNPAPTAYAPYGLKLSSTVLAPGSSATVSGKQLNGLTQAVAFGDDYQAATNFPLVKIVNDATNVVTFARTSGMTSMSVEPNVASSANFALPKTTPMGASELYVGANGIWSSPTAVRISEKTTVAFQSSAGNLIVWTSPNSVVNTHQGMMKGTSPSLTTLSNGTLEVAFQSNVGVLDVRNSASGVVNTHQVMMKGTSPSVTTLSNGKLAVAFESSAGNLIVWSPYGVVNTHQVMMKGTSPSITKLPNAKMAVAFQSSAGNLIVWTSPNSVVNTHQGMMKGTSPSLTTLSNGTLEVAFQSSAGGLNIWTSPSGGVDTHQGMMIGTSPSITTLPDGTLAVAFQSNAGNLNVWLSPNGGQNTHQVMQRGTSPSIT